MARSASTLAALCALLSLGAQPAASRALPANDEITLVCPEGGYPVIDLIRLANEVTDEPFLYDPQDLRNARVRFQGSVVVARRRMLAAVDLLLREADLVHLEEPLSGMTLHTIRALGQQARGQQVLKTEARMVSPEEAQALADRQVLLTTTHTLETLAASDVEHMICQYFSDSSCQSVRAIQGTNVIVLTGRAQEVVRAIGVLREFDRLAREERASPRSATLEERLAALEAGVEELVEAAASDAVEGRRSRGK